MAKSLTGKTEELHRKLDDIRDECLQPTKDWIALWQDGLNYVYNNQLEGQEVKDGWEPITANYIFPAVMQELALLSQRNTTLMASSFDEADATSASAWQQLLQWQHDVDLNMPMFLLRAALDGKIYGHYVAKVLWDDELKWSWRENRYIPGVKLTLVPPEYFGADPDADTIDEANMLFQRRSVDLELAKSRWPKHADAFDLAAGSEEDEYAIHAEYSTLALEDQTDDESKRLSAARLIDLLSRRRGGSISSQEGESSKLRRRKVTIEEFYFRDYERLQEELKERMDPDAMVDQGIARHEGGFMVSTETGETFTSATWPSTVIEKRNTPTFPTGRFVMRCGKTIINEKPENQVWPYQSWPFITGVNHILPHVWNGLNAVEMPKGMQDWVNVTARHLANYVKYFGDPIILKEENALPEKPKSTLRNVAGAIWTVAKGSISQNRITRLEPAGSPTGLFNIYKMFTAEARDQTGMHEVALGRGSGGGQTATEAIRLESNSKLRSALSHTLIDDFVVRLFRHVAEVSQHRYELGDLVRIVGENHLPGLVEITQGMKDVELDLKLDVITDLPFDRDRQKQEAMELFQAIGPPYLERLLRAYEVRKPEEILQATEAWMMIQQALEAQRQEQGTQSEGAPNVQT